MRTRLGLIVAVGGLLLAAAPVNATSYTFTTLDTPVYSSLGGGINSLGQAVGNNGSTSFLYSGGSSTIFSVPGPSITNAYGINDSGQIVGSYGNQGFLDTGGSFTFFAVPGASSTVPLGINDVGQIVGTFYDNTGAGEHGFLYSGGSFLTIDALNPLYESTAAFDINGSGEIVGDLVIAGNLSNGSGFFDTGGNITGLYDPLLPPGTITAFGINNSGQIVGRVSNTTGVHGFVDTGGSFAPVDVPGALQTTVQGINDEGVLLGYYVDAGRNDQEFLATPILVATSVPEPPSLALLCVAVLGMSMSGRRSKS